ncbi:MAG: DUF5716 family protein [Lachnospiraceae bacterium]|nr:DUF5716 family protein [Lachnospiraceae bacterium]
MQETVKLVLGIDLCDDITQVTVMRPHAAEPAAVCFDVRTRNEFLPTRLRLGQNGEWEIGETPQSGSKTLPPFFHAAAVGTEVKDGDTVYSGRELLECYVSLLIEKIRERFCEQEIGFVAVTCEEANTKETVRHMLYEIFGEKEGFSERCLVLSHLEAFLHFAIRQEEGLWKNGSAAFEYTTEGLLFYSMECRSTGGRRLLLADYKDYSEIISAGFATEGETGQRTLAFERLAETALQQKAVSLFVTGRGFEGDWAADVLRFLSGGRRVFHGQNLYTQGACYAGTEEFGQERNVDFSLLMPEQITADIYLIAENTAQEDGILMAKTGEEYRKVRAEAEVLLDATDKLTFRIVPAGVAVPVVIRVTQKNPELRGDRTSRYRIRLFFAERNLMVIQLKETGFGEFYPPSDRIYEELVDLSQLEL